MRALIADRRIDDPSSDAALAWGDDRGDLEIVACGRCATCEEQVIANRDLLMVARMRPVQRARLRTAGIETIDALAAATDGDPDVAVYGDEVTTAGRIELLPFLHEQAIAITAHRFGNPDRWSAAVI